MSAPSGLATALRVTAFNVVGVTSLAGPPFPGGESDIDSAFVASYPGAASVNYIAATIGLSTAPTDTPANTYLPGTFSAQIDYGTSLFAGIDPDSAGSTSLGNTTPILFRGSAVAPGSSALSAKSSTVGTLTILDPTFELDYLTKLSWDGATIDILRGDPATPVSTWTKVATFTSAGLIWDARQKQIKLRDLSWLLAAAPLHGTRYGGTGGIDGDVALANFLKPITYGQVFNITPPQLNAATLIYQVSFTSVQAITGVRDGGSAITPGADYATYALLAAATVAGGTYATCLALGLFRLGGQPVRTVTADVQGDADVIGGVGYTATRAGIARRIAIGRGTLTLTTAQLAAASFTAMDAGQPGICGYYFDADTSKGQALDVVLQGCLGYWFCSVAGMLSVGYLDDPSSTAALTFTIENSSLAITDGAVKSVPVMQDYATPRQATYLGYQKNYTIQPPAQQATSISGTANGAIYAAPTLQVSAVSGQILRSWPTADIVTIDSGFALLADAQAECTRQQRIMGKQRFRYQCVVDIDPYSIVLGLVGKLLGWTRNYMAGSWNGRIVAINVTGKNVVTISLWG